jgi:ZIP family zinc transporter
VTLHNIPEGLAVGVVFGALTMETSYAALVAALALAIGIGIQNIPEGVAISLPLRGEGLSRKKAFSMVNISGFVSLVAGVIGLYW